MNYFTLGREYVRWHYTRAYNDILGVSLNYLWFVNHLFSVPDVARSLFAPLNRLDEKPANLLSDPGGYFGNVLINFVMRLIGFFVRTILLFIALLCALSVLGATLVFLFIWTLLPLLFIEMFIAGISFIVAP